MDAGDCVREYARRGREAGFKTGVICRNVKRKWREELDETPRGKESRPSEPYADQSLWRRAVVSYPTAPATTNYTTTKRPRR